MQKIYKEPVVEVVEVMTEQGFRMSGDATEGGQPDGGDLGGGGWD
jgi:hypothetical protein